ncbi:MAG: PilX N-terminal domain-containing pilus assembly protein [Betaproteobacteria bacterium]|nr:PilX N-terminal domain-containing pilus assembly protein [Betaproteobacteria bacterium]
MTYFPFPVPQRLACPHPSRQQGAVLLIGMCLLIIITLLALAVIRGITIQERVAGGLYDRELAFSAAEATLRWAERQYMASISNDTPAIANFIATIRNANNDPVCGGSCSTNSPPNTEAYFRGIEKLGDMPSDLIRLDGTTPGLMLPKFESGSGTNTIYAAGESYYMAVRLSEPGDCGEAVRINAVGAGRNDRTIVVLESIVCQP